MTSFHADTGGWPYANRVWWADNRDGESTQINGTAFTTQDTSLFTLPPSTLNPPVPQCAASQIGQGSQHACWNGPYLSMGTDLGSAPWLDKWGHALMYSYLSPANGSGGGNMGAPNGLVFIWSRGPDGLDSFTCSDASCVFNATDYDKGEPSGAESDDLIIEVSDSSI